LKSENTKVCNITDKIQSDFVSHTIGCETSRKNTKSHFKKLEGLDFIEYQTVSEKINGEISRVCKVCVNLQKQISSIKSQKSYSAAVSPAEDLSFTPERTS
jgi:hypothetical protein